MAAEKFLREDLKIIYALLEGDPYFVIPHNYRRHIPPLTPMEDYFSEKKKKKNKCAWIKIGEHGCCGEPCKDVYCNKHLWMKISGSRIPFPCLVCGVGVINSESVCMPCRLEKEKRQLGLILAKQFENNDELRL